MEALVDKLRRERRLSADEYLSLLEASGGEVQEQLAQAAREVAEAHFGRGVFIRGLIELTSYCRNDCHYCGLRRSNTRPERYRLSRDQVLACCQAGNRLGFKTFVLQGGEDAGMSDREVEDIVRSIREAYPHSAITLSLGERSPETYRRWREAGADRYLLRHETASEELYGHLHPAAMSWSRRMECLHTLRGLGYQTGAGMMVGSPAQTLRHLVEDLLFLERFQPQMVGIGPYLPQADTPFAGQPAGSADVTLTLLSIVRLMLPEVLLPSTTALASLCSDGRERGILAGANVVMPNLSPSDVRAQYAIYDHKLSAGAEAAEQLDALAQRFAAIGYHINYDRGDYSRR